MNLNSTRVFIARLAGTDVFDPHGEPVGKVRDVVVTLRAGRPPLVLGLVVEVPPRRRIFLSMARVTSIEPGQVISTGKVDLTRFRQRPNETLAVAELLDRRAKLLASSDQVTIGDIAMEFQPRLHEWHLTRVYARKYVGGLRRHGAGITVGWDELTGLTTPQAEQDVDNLMTHLEDLRPADVAIVLRDLPANRRLDVARELDD